ncbi:hypothetical protein IJ118_00675 [Candidatus Saccharibacteria bacterium]|nr:hypothetical protein [Candidatus Saccharibacteria bacterium]
MSTTPHSRTRSAASSRVHAKRPRATTSHLARSKDSSRRVYYYSKRTILTVIILAMMAVILAVLFSVLTKPDRIIKGNIESLARDYYEHYYYDSIGKHSDTPVTPAEVLPKYAENGLAAISLKQLLYFDNERHLDQKSTLETYCDIDATSVRIFPEPPYDRTDYRIDYNYSCSF